LEWLLVGTGGIIGALLRYQISKWMTNTFRMDFPYPTLLINVSGSFLLGWFTKSLGAFFPGLGPAPFLLLGTGLCGAYTTFSTFSYEFLALLREKRTIAAFGYVLISFIFGFAFSGLGLYGMMR
jgi:fluoride exporter